METIASCLEKLAAHWQGFEPRPGQNRLSSLVEKAITLGKTLFVQAPTGVGKSLGYLIPAIITILADKARVATLPPAADGEPHHTKRVVITTASKELQNQLGRKDLPELAKLGLNFDYQVLKGRSNYVCLARAEEALENRDEIDRLIEAIKSTPNFSGEFDDLPILVSDRVRGLTASDADECEECTPGTCFYAQAKMKAKSADIVVVNHDLWFLDLALRRINPNFAIFGKYDHVIVDEAHHLEERGTGQLGESLTITAFTRTVGAAVKFGNKLGGRDGQRIVATAQAIKVKPFFDELPTQDRFGNQLSLNAGHMTALEPIVEQLVQLQQAVRNITWPEEPSLKKAHKKLLKRVTRFVERVERYVKEPYLGEDGYVRTIEETSHGAKSLELMPISVAPFLRAQWATGWPQVTFVSATLPFEYTAQRLGVHLPSAAVATVESPFDLPKQGLLYCPVDILPPDHKASAAQKAKRTQQVARRMLDLVKLSEGRALLLFTSKREMMAVYDRIAPAIRGHYTVLVQDGKTPVPELAKRFREDEHSVLFGMKTFMTGMDFHGKTCSLVVLDKLPFANAGDPLVKARCKTIEKLAKWRYNPRRPARKSPSSTQYMVPDMAMNLEQTLGRLIRRTTDYGVVAVLDPRLRTEYGSVASQLPPFTKKGDIEAVAEFFKGLK